MRSLRGAGDEVGDDHDVMPRQAVGPDPADEDEEDLRHDARGDDDPEVGRRPRQVEDCERERDRRERASEERDRPTPEEQSKLPLPERSECFPEHRRNLVVRKIRIRSRGFRSREEQRT